jgi:hypothetical protein
MIEKITLTQTMKAGENYVKNHNDLSIRNDIQFEEKNFVNVISAN